MTSIPAQTSAEPVNWSQLLRPLLYLFLTLLAIAFLIPVYGAVVTSLKTAADISADGYWNLPLNPTLNNFQEVLVVSA